MIALARHADHVDAHAGLHEAADAGHLVERQRDRALAGRHAAPQVGLRAAGGQVAAQQRLAGRHRHQGQAAHHLGGVREGAAGALRDLGDRHVPGRDRPGLVERAARHHHRHPQGRRGRGARDQDRVGKGAGEQAGDERQHRRRLPGQSGHGSSSDGG